MKLSEMMQKEVMRGTADDYMTVGEWAEEVAKLEAENEALKDVLLGLKEEGLIHDVTVTRHREAGGSYGQNAREAVNALLTREEVGEYLTQADVDEEGGMHG